MNASVAAGDGGAVRRSNACVLQANGQLIPPLFRLIRQPLVEQTANLAADPQLELDAGIGLSRNLVPLAPALERELGRSHQDLFLSVRVLLDLLEDRLAVDNDLTRVRQTGR